jgi:hypothetical protein
VFRTREMRLGRGVLYTPGTAVPTRPRMLRDRRLPHRSGASLISPVLNPAREVMLTRHHQGFPVSRPVPSLPLTCGPRPERGPLGFPASFTPGRYRPRMSRWGQVTDTNPESRHRHQPASTSTDSLLTCDLTSQAYRMPWSYARSQATSRPKLYEFSLVSTGRQYSRMIRPAMDVFF